MRVLFITKQLYMKKDLLRDRFGRFYELPRVLAQAGHRIRGVCLKYWSTTDSYQITCENVDWNSFSLGANWPLGFAKHYRRLRQTAADFKPDIIVGASDSAHVIMASWLAASFRLPSVVDLYDNFESYRATRLPGINQLLRRAVSNASAVSVVSENLMKKVTDEYHATGLVRIITNAVSPEIFHVTDKCAARRRLGLPEDKILIGTAGFLSRRRGIDTLCSAFEVLNSSRNDLLLVLAGPTDRQMKFPPDNKTLYLGELSHERVGDLFNALDIGVVCNRDDDFGRYCFPQKLFEMLACELPVAVADVGVMRRLLPRSECFLFDPDSVKSLAEAISAQLKARYLPQIVIPAWEDCGLMFENLLKVAVENANSSPTTFKAKQLSNTEG